MNDTLTAKPKVMPGFHAFVIREKRKRIQCPCCYDSKAIEHSYQFLDRLVLRVRAVHGMEVKPVCYYEFHKLDGTYHEDDVYPTRESAKLAIKLLRASDQKQLKTDRKRWAQRKKLKRNVW